MAFTRKWLTALGIEADKVEEIVSAHVEVVGGLTKERDELTAKVNALESEKTTLTNSTKETYDKLKKEFDDYKTDVKNKEVRAEKEKAYSDLLRNAGISEKRIGTILKVTDVDGLELDEDHKIKDEKDRVEQVKKEWSDFIETVRTQGTQVSTPPTNTGGSSSTMTKEQILEIKDTEARQKAIQQNIDLFMKGR